MGGSHKKKLRAEKAKVKLKGAKLPKGLNVTKTEFKVRKITIRQQHDEEPTYIEGHRLVSVKESLKKINQNSAGAKVDGLRSLREAIENKQPEIYSDRGKIVQELAAMCLEIEQDPRRESFRTLATLFSTLQNADEITPFFHIISAHLRCAMTHINKAIQEDSLLLLDVLLKYTPLQVAADSERILQNFLEMISRVRAEGDRASRTLEVHVQQTQTAVKWRTKVLLRLQQMLQTLVGYNAQNKLSKGVHKSEPRLQMFKVAEAQYYGLKRQLPASDSCSTFFSTDIHQLNLDKVDNLLQKEQQSLCTYIEHLMPLLLESWIEVRPQISGSHVAAQQYLNSDAASTLQIVLDIMLCLWSLVQQHADLMKHEELSRWFQQKYAQSFGANYLPGFPYQQYQQQTKSELKRQKQQQKAAANSTETSLRQNLCIVQLYCLFFGKKCSAEQQAKAKDLMVYVQDIVKDIERHNWTAAEDYQSLLQALRALLFTNVKSLLQSHKPYMIQLLKVTLNAYLAHKIPQNSGIAADLLVLLCEITESPELFTAFGGREQFGALLKQLPTLLLKTSISERVLLAMTRLAKQKNTIFLEALELEIVAVIENIQRIQVTNAANAYEGRKQIINLFYWTTRSWQQRQLLQLVTEHIPDKRVASYFQYIIEI